MTVATESVHQWLKFWQEERFADRGDGSLTELLEGGSRAAQISDTALQQTE